MDNTAVSMEDLYKKMKHLGPNDLILDVRSKDEFRSGHIPGSRNIPHDQVRAHFEELKKYQRIFVHCQAGKRASIATADLHQLGLTNLICISNSGMGDWINAGYPIEK